MYFIVTEAQSIVGVDMKICRKGVTWGIKEAEEKYCNVFDGSPF